MKTDFRYDRWLLVVTALIVMLTTAACSFTSQYEATPPVTVNGAASAYTQDNAQPSSPSREEASTGKDTGSREQEGDYAQSSDTQQLANGLKEDADSSLATTEHSVKPYSLSGKLLAVGDIMMHSPQFPAYVNKKTGKYDFNSYFSQVKPILESADWCWANLETPLLGGEKVYTGYPMFNAPPELADALKYAGFNIVTTANNHVLDRREKGALRTLEVLKDRGFVTKGTSASLWESEQVTMLEKNGIQLGILAYTYGTNGIPLPKKKPYLVSLIDEERMIQDIKKAKEAGADIVAIALHFGNEYETKPNQQQIQLARTLVQAGADIILGSHPHVLQPYERVTVQDADGHTRDGIIIYSLGNFISNQTGDGKDIGVIFGVEIVKHMPEGRIELKEITAEPTWVHIDGPREKRKYRVLPMSDTVMSHSDKRLTTNQFKRLQNMLNNTNRHLQSMSAVPVLLTSE
ncbi:CapA family protein [Paenibacillus apiarius]|uniref:CapA family protein n=1 Tax=Paenibacillus apiarius TaxID=46240 RepID=UPI003B3A7FD8